LKNWSVPEGESRRFKKPYSIVRRRKQSGKFSYSYRVWDPKTGKRLEYSTGQKSKQAAEHFCESLRESGQLVPSCYLLPKGYGAVSGGLSSVLTFQSFAVNWWGPSCPYTSAQEARGKVLSRRYRELCESQLRRHILPFFGQLGLGSIIPKHIEEWLFKIDGGPRVKSTSLLTLRVMLGEAMRLGLIPTNPCERVRAFEEPKTARVLFTTKEVESLFSSESALAVWRVDPLAHKACLLASRTGMRAGEVLGLQTDGLQEVEGVWWVSVTGSWDRQELKGTKTGTSRKVPIPRELADLLSGARPETGFVFSEDGGRTPISYDRVRDRLIRALEAIGVSKQEQKARLLGLHAFRHWLNTTLRGKVSDDEVRAIIGHNSVEMTNHYTSHSTETLAPTVAALRDVFKTGFDNEKVEVAQ
jgi:integrase